MLTSDDEMRQVVREALSTGGSYCDLYFEDNEFLDLLLKDSRVANCAFDVDSGCGVRVLSGEKTGYAYTCSTALPDLLSTARAAAAIVDSPSAMRYPSYGVPSHKPFYSMREDWRRSDCERLKDFLTRLDSAVRAADTRVSKVTAELCWSVSDILMYNSFGEKVSETRPVGSISLSVILVQGGRTESTSASASFRSGVEMLDDALLGSLVRDALDGVDAMFEAGRAKGGRMDVVMGAGASGILLHEAMGHAFEADFNRKGQSIFSDRMGTKVCPSGVNIVDDGTIPSCRGSINFDDEGVAGRKTYMVTDGFLTSYLHDRISAAYYGVEPTGNGRRESFRFQPIPRMRCTYMENGRDGTAQDLISGVRKGVYVDRFSNGEVKIGEGDFTFYVKSGRLIENGRLTRPVKDINIIGNGPQALKDIRGVAGDLRIDNGRWICGKGQSVAVSCGIPSVLIGGLTVGGV